VSRGQLAGCLLLVRHVIWGGFDQVTAKCTPVFEGLVAEGGGCFNDQQCASANCQETDPNCTDACCAGKCAPTKASLPKIGEACPEGVCEVGAYCQLNGMTCAARASEGQPCGGFDGCASSSGTLCDFDFMTLTGTCKKPAARGEACDPMSSAACDRPDDVCDPTTNVCTLRKLPGEACTSPTDCVAYAKCDPATMKCVKRGAEGAACVEQSDCLAGFTCEASKCTLDELVICK
jgi:hypothetical protein